MALSLSRLSLNESSLPPPHVHAQTHHHQRQHHLLFISGDCARRALWGKQTREEAGFSEPSIPVFTTPSPGGILGSPLWGDAVLKHTLQEDPVANLYQEGLGILET